jgi:phenylalanyl-tRNA synthetase alpha chain
MNDSLETLQGEVLDRIQQSGSEAEIEQLRVEILGRKGRLTLLLRGLKDLPAEERPRAGEQLNQLRREIEARLEERLGIIKEHSKAQTLKEDKIDITLPGSRWERGGSHPLTLVIDEIIDIFAGMGFEIARGPDIEDDYHNFEALNIPQDHPARDMRDAFSSPTACPGLTSPVRSARWKAASRRCKSSCRGAVYRLTTTPRTLDVPSGGGFMVDKISRSPISKVC